MALDHGKSIVVMAPHQWKKRVGSGFPRQDSHFRTDLSRIPSNLVDPGVIAGTMNSDAGFAFEDCREGDCYGHQALAGKHL